MMYALELNDEILDKTDELKNDWEVRVHMDGKFYPIDGIVKIEHSPLGNTYLVIAIDGARYERM